MLKPRIRRIALKLLPYPLVFFIGGLLYGVVELGLLGSMEYYPATGNAYYPSYSLVAIPIISVTLGTMVGLLEELWLRQFLSNRSFVPKVLLKSIVHTFILILVLFLCTFPFNAHLLGKPLLHPAVLQSVKLFFNNFAFWSTAIFAGSFIFLSLFLSGTIDMLGTQSIQNFFTGKYHGSKSQERIFMFLDMRSSTTIAEKLGDAQYYHLLRQYYDAMTDAIMNWRGEIYQYVGDEIIISWPYALGTKNDACLHCFYDIQRSLENRSRFFQDAFGIVPRFKAAVHSGRVTAGEVGVLKKDILFTGDVLNTTARIQGKCNELNADLLISSDLFQMLPKGSDFRFADKGHFALRGREEEMTLYAVSQ